jgi:hypothetical protein
VSELATTLEIINVVERDCFLKLLPSASRLPHRKESVSQKAPRYQQDPRNVRILRQVHQLLGEIIRRTYLSS